MFPGVGDCRLWVMTNQVVLEAAVGGSEPRGSGWARKVWRTFVILLLAAGLAPALGNSVSMGASWVSEGGEYLEDLPGLVVMTLAEAVPFLVLDLCAVQAKRALGFIVVSIATVVVTGLSAFGYWVVFFPGEDSSSTDALIFVVIIPVQWVAAAVAGAIVLVWGSRPVLRVVA